jgi:hypothetical protein
MIPVLTLRRLYTHLPAVGQLDETHQKALERLERFLDDKIADGEIVDQGRPKLFGQMEG